MTGFVGFNPARLNGSLKEDAKVSALIDKDMCCWKRDLVHACFAHEEASQIISVPLSHRWPYDELFWFSEKDGKYFVRPTYHLLQHRKINNRAGPSSLHHQGLWKMIWNS